MTALEVTLAIIGMAALLAMVVAVMLSGEER